MFLSNQHRENIMTNSEIQKSVITKIYSLIAKFEKHGDVKQKPVIKFTKKGSVAGTFSWGGGRELTLNFNMTLLNENFDDFMNSTVPHEVAHFLTYNCYGVIHTRNGNISHHGKEWKKMMGFLGTEAKRCHSYCVKNSSKRQKRWSYTCDCGKDHQVATVTHNRIQKGLRHYTCKSCGGNVVLA